MTTARRAGGRRRWTKWFALVCWILIVFVLGSLAGKLTGAEKNDASAWLPKHAESTQALNLTGKFQPTNTFPTIVIYERSSGITTADRGKAAADAQRFAHTPDAVGKVAGPLLSKDGRALRTIVNLKLGKDGWNGLAKTVDQLRTIAKSRAGGVSADAGLSIHVTGPGGYAADESKIFTSGGKLLAITGIIVIVILLLTYRSPLLWILPILTSVVALTTAEGLIYLLAKHAGLTVNGQSTFILIVLVVGAVTDYSLLLTARYREELRRHEDRHEAMAVALHRAGPAIVASGLTVGLAMLCLLTAELNSTKGLGPVCAIGVGVGLAAALTLLPALLTISGRLIFWPKRPRHGSAEPTAAGLWARTGRAIAYRPRTVWLGTALVLGVLASGVFTLHAGGLQSKAGFWGHKPEAVVGENVLDAHFPAGTGSPIQVIGHAPQAAAMRAALVATPGVSGVTAPIVKHGYAYLEGTLGKAPDSLAGYEIVSKARDNLHAVAGANAKVGGTAAINLDTSNASRHDRQVIIPLVLGVVFLILVLLLRALVAPLLLIATVVLSFAATLGVSALVFNHLFHFAGADPSLPLWVFVFLVALGIDYNIFLMTRVHEESRRNSTRRGVLIGLAATGGVITSAGVVLAGTFSALGTLPVVFITEISFAVAFGVLLDTIVVRSVLVTALTLDIGRSVWWPSKLSRKSDAGPPAIEEHPDSVLTT